MSPDLSPEAWAQIRFDYENTDRPIEDICIEHGVSSGTLRDRMRRWRWARRRMPIPPNGPPAVPGPQPDAIAASSWAAALPIDQPTPCEGVPPAVAGDTTSMPGAPDDRPIAVRLQSAVDRVLPAIEATLARLGTQDMHPREMERAARALASLTRTLRELNGLLGQRQDAGPRENVEVLRERLARKLEAFVASQADQEARRRGEPDPMAPPPAAGEDTIDAAAPEPRIRATDCP